MTTETTAPVDTSAPATADAPAPLPSREERRARMRAALDAPRGAKAEAQAPADEPAGDNSGDTTEAPADGQTSPAAARLAKVREQIRAQADARKARLAEQQRNTEFATLRGELEQLRSRPSIDTFLAEFALAPAATLRKYKLDPAQHLNLLTKDAITPGSIAAESQLEQLRAEFLTEKQQREQLEQQRTAAQQQAAYEAERQAIATYIESKADTWPLLAKTPAAKRIRLAVDKWSELQAEGVTEYSRDLVADAVEAELEELHQSWTPPASTPAAAAPAASPAATAKKPTTRTITPQLGTEVGAAAKKPWAERKKELARKLRQQAAAKDD